MSTPLYIVADDGTQIVDDAGDNVIIGTAQSRMADLAQLVTARRPRLADLCQLFQTFLIFCRVLDCAPRLRANVTDGYKLYARNVDTGVETYLGFVSATAAPLQLAGVALSDGNYEIVVVLAGYCWPAERQTTRFAVRILGGAVYTPLPALAGLTYAYTETQTNLVWSWIAATGEDTPDDFAIWTAAALPVSTAGAPAYVVAAAGAGSYGQLITQGAAILYVAACSRKGAVKGPFALLTIPAPPGDVTSPDNQAAHY